MDWAFIIFVVLIANMGAAYWGYSLGYNHGRADEIRHGNDIKPTDLNENKPHRL